MRLDTFFEKFELFADAPGAVARMRELVLQLAVEGNLTSSSSQEHPQNWNSVKMSELQPEFQNGASSRGDKEGLSVVVLRLADITSQRISLESPREITISAGDVGKYALRAGDTLITRVNGSADIVGSFIPVEADLKAIYCDHFIRMRLDGTRITPRFVALLGKTRGVRNQIGSLFVSTAGQKTVNQGHIGSLEIPLPPLAEQKRIVAKVDELMALCDRLEAQQQDRETRHAALARASLSRFAEAPTPADLDFLFHKSYTIDPADLRKSILTLAVQGKLMPQDADDEPAISTLEEIEAEKTALIELRKLRPNRVTEITQARLLKYDVPDSWRWFRLGDVAFFQEGPGIRNWQFRTEGTKLLNVQNIVDGRLVLENSTRYISNEEFEQTYNHFAVETGDILFASSGASWGKAAWFIDPGYTVMLNTSMIRLKFYSRRFDDAYLLLFLRTEFFKAQMEIQLVGIQPNFGSTHLGRVYIPIPPLAEQRRIVAKVDQLMALVDQLEAQLAASRAVAELLLEALVAELTANGP